MIENSPSLTYQFHTSTTDSWDAMLNVCSKAKQSIALEEYIIAPDTIGASFVDVLERKANQGVDIRLLLDWWGCRKFKQSTHYKRLVNVGVKIRFFRPPSWRWLISSPRFFPRDHRKILIIDDETTFVGGVCIYDDITNWRDTMVELSGSITRQFKHIFERTWQKVEKDETTITAHPDFETDQGFSVFANAPDSGENQFTEELLKHISEATSSIKLTTPYFTPGKTLLPALFAALNRGVKVDILLSEKLDKIIPSMVGKHIAGELINSGANIYYYQPSILHLKMMVIDNGWSAIGSCNLDGLSIHHNQEAMLVSTDQTFTNELLKHFSVDKENSVRLTLADWQARSLKYKIMGSLFLPIKHYL